MSSSAANLDLIDLKILRLLQEDGRMTNAALADAVGLTATPMLQRIRKLEQQGVIRRYMAVVDPEKLGRSVIAFVHVTLRTHGIAIHKKFLDRVEDFEEVLECHHIAGEEDFLLKVAVRNIRELETFLLHRLSTSDLIGRVKTTLILSSSKSMGAIPTSEEQESEAGS